jgi:uncharacterized protein (TIGR02757 family)
MPLKRLKTHLDLLYETYNRREFVYPDPLIFLYQYEDLRNREIVGLIASSLAYGRVEQIIKSIAAVLDRMPNPSSFLKSSSLKSLGFTFRHFKHRFTSGMDFAILLFSIKQSIEKYGSLYACFRAGFNNHDETVLPALRSFMQELLIDDHCKYNTLIPSPLKNSAFKRMNLFLRWMVRKDNVDPGGWEIIPASKLIVPLDTHLHRISLALNLTKRKQADIKTAYEITCALKKIDPEDPVKYDFALTRLGISGSRINASNDQSVSKLAP